MKKTDSQLRKEVRDQYLEEFRVYCEEKYGLALIVKGNKLAIPAVDSDQNDRWVELTISVPTGERDTEEGYNPEALADFYQQHLVEVKKNEEERKKKAAQAAEERKRKVEEKKRLKEAAALKKMAEAKGE